MTREQLTQMLEDEKFSESPLDVLDDRELEIFSMIAQGSPGSMICRELKLEPDELATLKKAMMSKLQLQTEVQLIQFAAKHRAK